MIRDMITAIQDNASAISLVLFSCIGYFMIACTVMEARRPVWGLFLFMLLKSLYTQFLTPVLSMDNTGLVFNSALNSLVFPLLAFALIGWFFKGSLVKNIFLTFLTECLSALVTYGSMGLAARIWPENGWMSFPVYLVFFGACYLLARPFLLKLRSWNIRNTKVFLACEVVYFFVAVCSYFIEMRDAHIMAQQYCISAGLALIALLIPFGYYMKQNRRRIQMESEYLEVRKSLIETRYATMRGNQSVDYNRMLRVMDEQMKELAEMDASEQSSDRIKAYLSHLKQEYRTIRAGVYCDDPMTDTVLCYQAEHLAKRGITFSCSYQIGTCVGIEENDWTQMLMRLLDWATTAVLDAVQPQKEKQASGEELSQYIDTEVLQIEMPGAGKVALKLAELKGQIIIQIAWNGNAKIKRPQKPEWMKPYLKKYQGVMRLQRGGDGMELTIGLGVNE